ncbi:hypothetical protein Misp01_16680 [Microtetraspora sp. NBRC 13810]|uniref:hypothetical protein n=1 Tax=Microtetraspora sp. NBRC 13810 TaxID=3030990 RepID=UPI0024A42C10|nr:hypothetical protein [Microtetraspora sp. NBRC 13810]GLW06538.1 hypothetical protein Misp01_16680 [Microtetraspora sp. NBRC 13810]
MNPTRKMWISAGVVGAVLVGGVSVAAAATTGRLATVSQETKTVVTPGPEEPQATPSEAAQDPAGPTDPEDYVVSGEINPDPAHVGEYWTDDRLEQAEPMPMPMVTFSENATR